MRTHEWFKLYDLCIQTITGVGNGLHGFDLYEIRLLTFVLGRTLSWYKLFDKISIKDLLEGVVGSSGKARFTPHFTDRSNLYRIKKRLILDEWVFEYKKNGKKELGVNISKLLSMLEDHAKLIEATNLRDLCREYTEKIKLELVKYMKSGKGDYSSADVETVVKEFSAQTKERKKLARLARDAKTEDVRELIDEYCETFHNNRIKQSSIPWTSKIYGMAKNWLSECKKRKDKRPYEELLADAVRYWPQYCYKIENRFGKKVVKAREVFSFEIFYANRRDIEPMIEAYKENPKADIKIIWREGE